MGTTHHSIDTKRRIIFTRMSGSIRYSDIIMHIESVTEDPLFSTDYDSLAVIEEGTTFNFLSEGDNSKLSTMIGKYTDFRPDSKWALVIPENLKTQIETAVKSFEETKTQFGLFNSEEEALTWLKE